MVENESGIIMPESKIITDLDQGRKGLIYDLAEARVALLTDFLHFTQTFYKLVRGRKFDISKPYGRESHYTAIIRGLNHVFAGTCKKLLINVPPRHGKTELVVHFIAWCLAHYPDSNFLYVSASKEVAVKATTLLRDIISSPYYTKLFGVSLRPDSKAKSVFTTKQGGSVEAVGAKGAILGRGGGIRGADGRFGGFVAIDDFQKPGEAEKEVRQEDSIVRYHDSILTRRNDGVYTPVICICQRLAEGDLPDHLIRTEKWDKIILPALDFFGNALCPRIYPAEELREMQKNRPHMFAAIFQQNPLPAGGTLYIRENLIILNEAPEILKTFITVDCAETAKTYNDATVFSLWGIYKIRHFGQTTEEYALHWLDCVEIFVEPSELELSFMEFYASSNRHGRTPAFCAIEKKSTGTTLASVLGKMQGIKIIPIDRTSASGSKADRFIRMEEFINKKLITLPYGAQHTKMCIDHMMAITANESERRSDIADTAYDACKMTFIDKTAISMLPKTVDDGSLAKEFRAAQDKRSRNRAALWGMS